MSWCHTTSGQHSNTGTIPSPQTGLASTPKRLCLRQAEATAAFNPDVSVTLCHPYNCACTPTLITLIETEETVAYVRCALS